ncbi:helix-turn-helix domain-containing protein [Hyphococcus sp.]|jgi:transcriptional regulator with XRE-family HTH domain|uniref:helix-turn-helix domain-containing protein n=1 Tax=Hyphococcus sp. TaxID=2038636 RepID=UPI003D14A43A
MGSRQLIARNLRAIRLSNRISQEELALEADIDRAYVSGLERGLRNPTVDLLDKLADALDVKARDFFAETPITPKPKALPRGRRQK